MFTPRFPLRQPVIILGLSAISVAVLLGLGYLPESFLLMRLLQVAAALTLLTIGIMSLKPLHRRVVLALLLGFGVLAGIRAQYASPRVVAYVASLLSYVGTPYVWGGESPRGLDCSGLLRRAYVMACLRDVPVQGDPGLLARAFVVWLNDASAAHLQSGYDGRTVPTGVRGAIATMDPGHLLPGDLAITVNGIHCLAYLGEGRWISADPGAGQVIITCMPDPTFSWFLSQVVVQRWKALKP